MTRNLASKTASMWPFSRAPKAEASEGGVTRVRTRRLAMEMRLNPLPVKLSDSRHLDVRITLENRSKRFVQLEFPSTQRIELLINEDGKLVTKWSDDQIFGPGPSYVGINPGERVEYASTISTRDLKAGRSYTVTGFFPSFEELTAQQTLVPEN